MKRLLLLFVLTAALLTEGNAQQSSALEISVSSGYVIPASPMTFANYWKMQYGGGIGVGTALSESVTLLGTLEYYRFALDKDGIGKGFDTKYMSAIWIFSDVSLNPSADPSSVMTVSANVRISPVKISGMLSPYVVAGAGAMRFSLSEITLPTTSVLSINGSNISMTAQQKITGGNETSAFFQGGIGVDVRLAPSLLLFVEGRYQSGLNKGLRTALLPITAGVRAQL